MILNKNTVFDYKTHRENFIDYLEVIIFKDGHIEYAVPSHQMKLIDIYCKEKNISIDELYEIIPETESPTDWIILELGVISVWYEFIISPSNITKEQEIALQKLVEEKCISPNYRKHELFKNKYGFINKEKI